MKKLNERVSEKIEMQKLISTYVRINCLKNSVIARFFKGAS